MNFEFTPDKKPSEIRCQQCGSFIASSAEDGMIPSFQECYLKGNVPVPNFGWLCSQNCASKYEIDNKTNFAKTEKGIVDYYENEIFREN